MCPQAFLAAPKEEAQARQAAPPQSLGKVSHQNLLCVQDVKWAEV